MTSRTLSRILRLAALSAVFSAVIFAAPMSAYATGIVSPGDAETGDNLVQFDWDILSASDTDDDILIISPSDLKDDQDDAVVTPSDLTDNSHEETVTVTPSDAVQIPETDAADTTQPPASSQPLAAPGDGWQTSGGISVYYANGVAQTGTVTVNGLTYYVGSGFFEPVNGWKEVSGKRYYFADGIARTGSFYLDGKVYFFADSGELLEYDGWKEMMDSRSGQRESFYFSDGGALTGVRTIEGRVYSFDTHGRLEEHTGWTKLLDNSGREISCYYADGGAVTGLRTIDGVKYLFESSGALASRDGWHTVESSTYYVKSGRVQTGFVRVGDAIYYLGDEGVSISMSGWITVDGGRYLLSEGRARTGIVYSDGNAYYLDANYNGRMLRGLINADGALYYAGSDGALSTGLRTIGGKVYYFGSSYAAVTGWQTVGADRYYFGSDKYALTGWFQTGGYHYYGGENGAIKTNCTIDGYKLDDQGRRVASSKLEEQALAVINSCTNSSMSSADKLKACYNWIIKNCSYKRDYADPNKMASGWTEKYALEMLGGKKGNCYRYASAFAYLAETLGYDASVVTGKIVAYGGGMTPHGWAQVKINGTNYIFDANMDDSKGTFICYMKTYGNYPYYITRQATYDVKI